MTEVSSVALTSGVGFIGVNLRKLGTQINVNNTTFSRFFYGGAYVDNITDPNYQFIHVRAKRKDNA